MGKRAALAIQVSGRFGVRFRVRFPSSVWTSGSDSQLPRVWSGLPFQGSVQSLGEGPDFGLEFGSGVRFTRVPSSVWSSGSGFGSGFRSRVRSRFGVRFRIRVPEFSLEFRFGVRFRVQVGAPTSVLSSGSGFWWGT